MRKPELGEEVTVQTPPPRSAQPPPPLAQRSLPYEKMPLPRPEGSWMRKPAQSGLCEQMSCTSSMLQDVKPYESPRLKKLGSEAILPSSLHGMLLL